MDDIEKMIKLLETLQELVCKLQIANKEIYNIAEVRNGQPKRKSNKTRA